MSQRGLALRTFLRAGLTVAPHDAQNRARRRPRNRPRQLQTSGMPPPCSLLAAAELSGQRGVRHHAPPLAVMLKAPQRAKMPAATLRPTYAAATKNSPRRNRCTVSSPNAENVVNPPTRPVNSSKRTSGEKYSAFSARAARIPATRQPRTFTRNVPAGKRQSIVWCRTNPESLYLATDPTAPPSATNRMAFNSRPPFVMPNG